MTARSLRFYEAGGLLAPRREGTRRDWVRLKLILRGKRLDSRWRQAAGSSGSMTERAAPGRRGSCCWQIGEQRRQLESKRRAIDAMLAELDRVGNLIRESTVTAKKKRG